MLTGLQRTEFTRLLKKAQKKLALNWATAEWALFQVNGQVHLVINGALKDDPEKDRRHEQTFLNETGIPVKALQAIAPRVDWGERQTICRITEIEQAIQPLASGPVMAVDEVMTVIEGIEITAP